jgi:hypothetical protein
MTLNEGFVAAQNTCIENNDTSTLLLWLSIILNRIVLHHFFEELGHRFEACLVSFKIFEHDACVLASDCRIEFE